MVKQSRPYLEKYPQIPAPIDRIAVEYAFYQKINQHPMLTGFSPKIKGFDPMFHIIRRWKISAMDQTFSGYIAAL